MALKAGTPSDLSASMAEEIQNAFTNYYPEVMGTAAPPSSKQMQLLFVAISRGVIKHLRDHPEAFVIKTTFDGTPYNAVVEISGN